MMTLIRQLIIKNYGLMVHVYMRDCVCTWATTSTLSTSHGLYILVISLLVISHPPTQQKEGYDICTTTTCFSGNPCQNNLVKKILLMTHGNYFEGFGMSQSSLPSPLMSCLCHPLRSPDQYYNDPLLHIIHCLAVCGLCCD